MNDPRLWLAGLLAALLAAAPLMFGSTPRPAYLSLVLAAGALAVAALTAGARLRGRGWLPMGLVLCLGLAQLVPLPPALLGLLSPRASRLHGLLASALPGETAVWSGRWHPISLDPHATLMSLLVLGSAACVFGAARFTLSHPAARRLLIGALLASGLFQATYGMADHLSGRDEILGWPKVHYTDCASGTFVNRNHFAGYLEMTLLLCLGVTLALSAALRPEGSSWSPALVAVSTPRGGAVLLLAAAACVMAAALVLSRSRAGAASAAGGLLVLVGLSRRGTPRRVALGLVAGSALAGVLYAGGVSPAPLAHRFDRAAEDLSGSEGRLPVWLDAARTALAFPATGSGLGTFEHVFPAQRTNDGAQLYRHAHNDYLDLAAELGLPGLLLGLLLAVRFLARAARAAAAEEGGSGRRVVSTSPLARGAAMGGAAAAAALALHSFFDFNLHVPANLLTLSAVAALALPGPDAAGPDRPRTVAA